MFTGIIEELGTVAAMEARATGARLVVRCATEDLEALELPSGRQPQIGSEVLVLALVSIHESAPATANLLAPVVVNVQAVPSFEAFPFALWADTAGLTWFSWLEVRRAAMPWSFAPLLPKTGSEAVSTIIRRAPSESSSFRSGGHLLRPRPRTMPSF